MESWHLFISNRAGQARVIDARQTMHVSGAEAGERRDGFQMRDVRFYRPLLSANLPYGGGLGGGGALLSNIWSKLTSCFT